MSRHILLAALVAVFTRSVLGQGSRLTFLRSELAKNPFVGEEYNALIPTTVAELSGKASDPNEDAVIRAASWFVTTDSFADEREWIQRFALAVIYYKTGGANWKDSTMWLSDNSSCDWYGVACCSFLFHFDCPDPYLPAVVELDLYYNNLVGEIPTSFPLFPKLISLFLSRNELTGQIPAVPLSNIPQLKKLYLNYNKLTGSVPSTLIQNGLVDTFFVQGNRLTGVWPDTFCPQCVSCDHQLEYFALDCEEIVCSERCCRETTHCFIHED